MFTPSLNSKYSESVQYPVPEYPSGRAVPAEPRGEDRHGARLRRPHPGQGGRVRRGRPVWSWEPAYTLLIQYVRRG